MRNQNKIFIQNFVSFQNSAFALFSVKTMNVTKDELFWHGAQNPCGCRREPNNQFPSGKGAVTAKVAANVLEIVQLSNLATLQLNTGF